MSWRTQLEAQIHFIKLPLIVTGVTLVLVVGGMYLFHVWKPAAPSAILEAPAPAAALGNIVFYKEGDEFPLYFALYDGAREEVARAGMANVKISQLGTIGIEGGREFVSETSALAVKFEVGLSSYRWIDIGGGLFFHKRQLVIPKRIPANIFTKLPRSGAKCKITIDFRDAKVV